MSVAFVSELLTPMEVVEKIVTFNKWEFDRAAENELMIFVEGRYAEYQVSFTWFEGTQVLHLACGFKFEVKPKQLPQMRELTRLINESLWVGHFDYWSDISMVLHRHSLLCSPEKSPTVEEVYAMIVSGLAICEEHHISFRFVVEDSLTAANAIALNIAKTDGNA